jgi:hypothetical protein
MQTFDEVMFGPFSNELIENWCPDSCHDTHWANDVRGIGQLDSNLRHWRTQWSHAVRYDVHCTTCKILVQPYKAFV